MSDQPDAQRDLKGLVESLRSTCSSVREWARDVQEEDGGEARTLSRQLDRAAQFLDQSARALSRPAPEQSHEHRQGVPGLTGSTEAIPLSSLVSFLAEVGASGVLRIYAVDESFVLQFQKGYLIYAFGDNPPEGARLGEVLVEQGAILRADLQRVLDQDCSVNDTLGGLLLAGDYVKPRQLKAALEAQIQGLGKRLFSHDDARFRFYPAERVIERQDVRMNVMGLLLESARVRDEEEHAGDPFVPPLFDIV